jgi:hypothetical protein
LELPDDWTPLALRIISDLRTMIEHLSGEWEPPVTRIEVRDSDD